jgi:hypothetical protein
MFANAIVQLYNRGRPLQLLAPRVVRDAYGASGSFSKSLAVCKADKHLLFRGVGANRPVRKLAEEIRDVVEDSNRQASRALDVGIFAGAWMRSRRYKHLGPRKILGQALGASAVLI